MLLWRGDEEAVHEAHLQRTRRPVRRLFWNLRERRNYPNALTALRGAYVGKTLSGFRQAAFVFLFFSALNFTHHNFVAFEIFALAAADNTRFLTCVTPRLVVSPSALAAARRPGVFREPKLEFGEGLKRP